MQIDLKEDELIKIFIDTEIPVLIHSWLREPSEAEFKAGLIELQKVYLEQKKSYENLKWLADTKLLGQRSYEEEQWLEKVWEQLLFEEAGVKVHAVILGDDIFADYSMEKFKSLAAKKHQEDGVELGVFLNEENAMSWLKER
jgi:hypothetical protein